MTFHICCRVCGKVAKTTCLALGGFTEDGTPIEFCPGREGSEPMIAVCGIRKISEGRWQISKCRIALEKWINEKIASGWLGFTTSFPEIKNNGIFGYAN